MTNDQEVLALLHEIRDLLTQIAVCYEDQYAEIQQRRQEQKLEEFYALMTPIRWRILPLIFDPANLLQDQIAEKVGTSQPTVSKFITALSSADLIDQEKDADGNTVYVDKYNLNLVALKPKE